MLKKNTGICAQNEVIEKQTGWLVERTASNWGRTVSHRIAADDQNAAGWSALSQVRPLEQVQQTWLVSWMVNRGCRSKRDLLVSSLDSQLIFNVFVSGYRGLSK